jgi:hypothetical protein
MPWRAFSVQSNFSLAARGSQGRRPGAIVDVVAAADEMPSLPHIDLTTLGHYAVTKIKEAILAVTGS